MHNSPFPPPVTPIATNTMRADMHMPTDPSIPLSPIPSINAPFTHQKPHNQNTHTPLPPVGSAIHPTQNQPSHTLQHLDDATYLEVMEHDVLAAQAQIAKRSNFASAISTTTHYATTSYSERELTSLRTEQKTILNTKLQLHEMLAEKLKHLERLALVEAAARTGHADSALARLAAQQQQAASNNSTTSRLPSLLALLNGVQWAAAAAPPPTSMESEPPSPQKGNALDDALARCAQAEARAVEAEARAAASRGEADELRTTLQSRAVSERTGLSRPGSAAPAPSPPPPKLHLPGTNASRPGSARRSNAIDVSDSLRVVADAEAAASRAGTADAALQRDVASAAHTIGLSSELESCRARLAKADAADADAASARAALAIEREGREAAERRADCAERQCELLTQAAGGDESLEAALAGELSAMRTAYEAKLLKANEALRDAEGTHRRELHALHEATDRERRAAEARLRAAANGEAPLSAR